MLTALYIQGEVNQHSCPPRKMSASKVFKYRGIFPTTYSHVFIFIYK